MRCLTAITTLAAVMLCASVKAQDVTTKMVGNSTIVSVDNRKAATIAKYGGVKFISAAAGKTATSSTIQGTTTLRIDGKSYTTHKYGHVVFLSAPGQAEISITRSGKQLFWRQNGKSKTISASALTALGIPIP